MADNKSKFKNENFYVIHGWMMNELNLKGNELLVYAVIYGFSQTENQFFTGSLQYLMSATKASRQTIINCLNSMTQKGLISKREKNINGVKFCEYRAKTFTGGQEIIPQGVKNLDGGSQNSGFYTSIYNIEYNIDDRIEKETPPPTPETVPEPEILSSEQPEPEERTASTPYEAILEAYNTICKSLPKAISLNNDRKKAIRARLHDDYTAEQMKQAFANAEASPFLTGKVAGRDGRTFKASFDWIMTDKYFIRVLEGRYAENKPAQSQQAPVHRPDTEQYSEEFLRSIGVIQ